MPDPTEPDPTEPDPVDPETCVGDECETAPEPEEPEEPEVCVGDECETPPELENPPVSGSSSTTVSPRVTNQIEPKTQTLQEQATKEALEITSDSGSSTWKIILIFFSGAGIFLLVAVLRRKRCLHCGRPLTLKDDILLDDEDNPECEENPEGKEHELRNDKRNEYENIVHSN